VKTVQGKLSNENFVKNAPSEVVESEREKLSDAEKVLKSHQELLELFK
jgi:valyl-tRNA synthetase